MKGLRRVALAAGLLVVAAMGAFPPWVTAPERHPSATTPVGYYFILKGPAAPPTPSALDEEYGRATPGPRFVRIDYARLLVQWVIVAAVVGLAMLLPWPGARRREAVTRENEKANLPEVDLIDEGDRGPGGGAQVESRRRLRLAVEKQTRASAFLAYTMIGLMIVQILVAVLGRR